MLNANDLYSSPPSLSGGRRTDSRASSSSCFHKLKEQHISRQFIIAPGMNFPKAASNFPCCYFQNPTRPLLSSPLLSSPPLPSLPSFLLPVRRSPLSTKGNFQGYGHVHHGPSPARGPTFAPTIPCKYVYCLPNIPCSGVKNMKIFEDRPFNLLWVKVQFCS